MLLAFGFPFEMLHDVSQVHRFASNARLLKDLVQKFPRRPDEWFSHQVFVKPRLLSNKNDLCSGGLRVGNEEYVRENESFGLTTMKARHVNVKGAELHFEFRGKSGRWHSVDVQDRRLAKVVKKCQDLPGQELFQYVDKEEQRQNIKSNDVNEYLREISGEDFTAKDFRTWAGTVLAAMALCECERFDSKAEAKRNLLCAIESVAQKLGNTANICRKCYIHPEVISAYLDGTLARTLRQKARARLANSLHKLSPEEAAVLALLERRLAAEAPSTVRRKG
jgi:DNA topoisomerase-1